MEGIYVVGLLLYFVTKVLCFDADVEFVSKASTLEQALSCSLGCHTVKLSVSNPILLNFSPEFSGVLVPAKGTCYNCDLLVACSLFP